MSINRVVLVGRLTADPEMRAVPSGMSVLKMRLAFNDRRKNAQTGDWDEHANYIDVTMFGTRAEGVSRVVTKGMRIGVDGKLRWREWESQTGEKRSALEVIADDIEFLDSRGEGGGGGSGRTFAAPATPDLPSDDEIPF
jgi:single-strand DNA-binding protein